MLLSRRKAVFGMLTAPAIIRSGVLMPVKMPKPQFIYGYPSLGGLPITTLDAPKLSTTVYPFTFWGSAYDFREVFNGQNYRYIHSQTCSKK